MGLAKVKEDLEVKIKVFLSKVSEETDETKEAAKIIQKHIKGEPVSDEEEQKLKEQFFDILKITGIGIPFMLIPGASLLLPAIVIIAKKYNIELLPSSFQEKKEKIKSNEE
jgi:hypothetical protein